MTTEDDRQKRQPKRVKVNTSLVERPLFMGVDIEFIVAISFAVYVTFLVFSFSFPFLVMLILCGGLFGVVKNAYKEDQYLILTMLRGLPYKSVYRSRSAGVEQGPVRSTIPENTFEG